jgi:predicted O-methyltransferase YrrM
MAWLARMIGAKVIVEAGTYGGAATRILAEVNPHATVWTADPMRHSNISLMLDDHPNIIYHEGDFIEMLERVPVIDFAYIDATTPEEHGTAHTYSYRHRSGQAVAERLSPNGIICYDDTNPKPWREPFPELALIQDFCQINLRALKGFSIYQSPRLPAEASNDTRTRLDASEHPEMQP